MYTGFKLVGFVAALILVGLSGADAQRGGGMGGGMGGGRGGMRGNSEQMEQMRDQMEAMRAFNVDAMWAALSLGMDIEESKLGAMRMIMTDAWKKRQEWLALAQKHGTWKDYKEELEDLKDTVEDQVKAMLDKDQQKQLKTLLKRQDRMVPKGRF